jgi:hypothetical protein
VTPNPASEFITVNGNPSEKVQLEIYDITGKLAICKTVVAGEQVSVAVLPIGLYTCIIREGEQTSSFKLVKE